MKLQKVVLIFLSLTLSTISILAETVIQEGSVSGTWTLEGSPYIVEGTVEIVESLTIEPGVEVKFAKGCGLKASTRNDLVAIGREDAPIIFTSNKDNPVPGDWSGIELGGTLSATHLSFFIVEYAQTGIYCWAYAKGCSGGTNKAVIENSVIRYNLLSGIRCKGYASGSTGCSSEKTGNASPTINHNSIYENGNSGIELEAYDGYKANGRTAPTIERNIIVKNGSNGISCAGYAPCNPEIFNNTISENSGAGIRFESNFHRFSFLIFNNIIVSNEYGLESTDEKVPSAGYNNVWGNSVDYQGVSAFEGDISADPLFVATSTQDYHLQISSPCIDAGDPGIDPDPDGTHCDIGALYVHFPAKGLIAYSQLAIGGGWESRLSLANKTASEWQGRANLRTGNNELWTQAFSVNGTTQDETSSIDLVLAPRSAKRLVFSSSSATQTGYLEINDDKGLAHKALTTSFAYNHSPGGYLVDTTGSPEGRAGTRFWFPVEKSASVNTGIAYSTAGSNEKFQIRFTLFDQFGQQLDQKDFSYLGQSSRFIASGDGIFDELPDGFLGAIQIESVQPIFLTVLRTTQTLDGLQLTSVPPLLTQSAVESPSPSNLMYPQLALGGGYECILIVSNPNPVAWSGKVEVRQGRDQPWDSSFTVNQGTIPVTSASFQVSLDPGQTQKYVLISSTETKTGYLVLGNDASSGESLATSFFYQYRSSGILVDSTGTPRGEPGRGFRFPVERTESSNTGFAFFSTENSSPFQLTLSLFDETGLLVDGQVLDYEGHTARFFAGSDGIFSNVGTEFLGAVRIESEEPLRLTVIQLITNHERPGWFQLTSQPPSKQPVFGEIERSFPTPGPLPSGLAYDGTYLWNVDDSDNRISQMDLEGNEIDSIEAPHESPSGLAFDGTFLWNADSRSGMIYKIALGPTEVDSFETPWYAWFPSEGLAFDGTFLWLAESYTGTIYKMDLVGNIQDSFASPGPNPRGMAFDGTYLWIANAYPTYSIDKVDLEGNIVDSFPVPGGQAPGGLAFDGSHVWIAESQSHTIYKLDLEGNIVDFLTSPGSIQGGLAFDGTDFWLGDTYKDIIYKMDLEGNIVDSFPSPGSGPEGLAFDGTYLWIADDGTNKVHKFAFRGSIADSFNSPGSAPGGLAFDGSYLWCADDDSKEIYKIDLDGSVVDTFPAPGTNPTGLAFDGTFLWNADRGKDRIFKLDMNGTVVDSVVSPGTGSWGLAFDGAFSLWNAGWNNKIYRVYIH